MRSPAVLAGALLAGLSLTAQTEPTRAPAAATPHVLIDTVGPDGWRSRFGPTNLGSMLESEQGRELWEPALAPYFAIWQELAGDDAGYSASRTRLLGYGGRIRMGLWFDSDRMRRASEPAAGIAGARRRRRDRLRSAPLSH